MRKHEWKHWNGVFKEQTTKHDVHFREGNSKGLLPGLYCETHGKWVVIFHHDHIEITGYSCVRKDTIRLDYQE